MYSFTINNSQVCILFGLHIKFCHIVVQHQNLLPHTAWYINLFYLPCTAVVHMWATKLQLLPNITVSQKIRSRPTLQKAVHAQSS